MPRKPQAQPGNDTPEVAPQVATNDVASGGSQEPVSPKTKPIAKPARIQELPNGVIVKHY